jgi:hypothetical protein
MTIVGFYSGPVFLGLSKDFTVLTLDAEVCSRFQMSWSPLKLCAEDGIRLELSMVAGEAALYICQYISFFKL